MNINEGARIIIQDWLHAQREDVIHLITDETKLKEARAFEEACLIHGAVLKTTIIPSNEVQSAEVIEELEPGDYVMVHAGIAIAKITADDTEETDEIMEML